MGQTPGDYDDEDEGSDDEGEPELNKQEFMDFISKEMLDNDGKGQDELQIAYRTFCGG